MPFRGTHSEDFAIASTVVLVTAFFMPDLIARFDVLLGCPVNLVSLCFIQMGLSSFCKYVMSFVIISMLFNMVIDLTVNNPVNRSHSIICLMILLVNGLLVYIGEVIITLPQYMAYDISNEILYNTEAAKKWHTYWPMDAIIFMSWNLILVLMVFVAIPCLRIYCVKLEKCRMNGDGCLHGCLKFFA